MKNRGCAFEIQDGGKSRYFVSPTVSGLADFARAIYENRAGAAGSPLPPEQRIPQAEEISGTAWLKIADDPEAGNRFSCFFVWEVSENRLWVNEDTGGGLANYLFPFGAVLEEAAAGSSGLWERLLARFPGARLGGQ